MICEGAYNIELNKYFPSTFVKSLLLLLLLFIISSSSLLYRTFATSPYFGYQEITNNKRNHWVQTYGNDITHLKSDYTNILAVSYLSDGKVLNATYWLASNLENASTYNQPYHNISYGMLIDADMNPKTGYSGADYDFYIEAINGKWSQYLYQYSHTGNYALIGSKTNYTEPFGGSSTIGPGHVKLQFPLRSINYPGRFSVSFYAAESYKSNEVRDFTSWVAIPPPPLKISTSPDNIVIRQGEQQVIPAEINTVFSNNVTTITFNKGLNEEAPDFNSGGLRVSVQRIQPPLFKVEVSPQTPVGIYTVPFTASIIVLTTATPTKPIFNNTVSGFVDPEFTLSKRYPTVGYITNAGNLTITVMPPLNINDEFKAFWGTYGQTLSILMGGFAGGFASLVFGRIRKI